MLMMPRLPRLPVWLAIMGLIVLSSKTTLADETTNSDESYPISFNAEVRPILSEYCFACHGPDSEDRAADLRLDEREPAVQYGAIIAGEPEESPMIQRIRSGDPDVVMPPPETGKTMTPAQKELLARWIEQGGEYQAHWSFQSVPNPAVIPDDAGGWTQRPMDAFVSQMHRRKGLRPGVPAERGTWLRRVTVDLTGLPPTIDELDAFLADESADAYELVVDRLLQSPAYGERMAVMWLDVARYADTFGYQNDVAMEVWPWRQWVIESFNRNLPYDQFLTQQIAGDMIPDATRDQQLATTFNRLHRQTNEGGSVAEEFRLTGITDRTTTAATAFLGLTMECCRCHDHKFDPIRQTEFYGLSAYFSDIDEFGLYSHFTRGTPTPALLLYAGDQESEHQSALAAVDRAESHLKALMQASHGTTDTQLGLAGSGRPITELPEPRPPVFTMPLDGDVPGIVGTATRCNGDDPIACADAPRFGRTSTFSYSLWVRPSVRSPRMMVMHQSRAAEDSAFRGLELVVDDGHPQFSMIHFWPGNAVQIRTNDAIPTGQWTHLAVTHDGSGRADGLRLFINGRLAPVDVIRDQLTRDIRHRKQWGDLDTETIGLAIGARFRDVGFRDGDVDELGVYNVQLSDAEILAIVAGVSPKPINTKITTEMAAQHHALTADESIANARNLLAQARDRENEIVAGVREIMTMRHTADAPPTHVLGRGEYTNKEQIVSPGVPALSGGLPAAGADRMSLARWMVDDQNPLTSRVIANRMWHLFFGRGLVVSLEDFGSQGTPPTHPELLDYLSRSLMDHDWDLHWLCREIVLSSTYRQSSVVTDAAILDRDPENAWLTRGPKHRMSAEQLRDTVLAASGLLVPKIGGPSVMPYQPAGLWEEAGTGASYKPSTGDGLFRRSLYTFWKRTSPPPTMLTLDATSRESCTPRRELTTTPLQALVFLNDPQIVEASRVLAEKLIQRHGDAMSNRWDELCRRLIARPPHDRERGVIERLYAEQRQTFRDDPTGAQAFLQVGTMASDPTIPPDDLAATTIVVQTMFAYDETIMLR